VRAILTRAFFVLCLIVPAIVTIGCGSSTPAQSTTTVAVAQTITFGALPGVTDGVAPITLTATASSGLAVSYAVTGPATVSGSTLTITGAGSVTVTASQAGNSNFTAATPVAQTFAVTTATAAANVQPISVNVGPTFNYVDGVFTSVTVCVPGSTTQCQTIDGILVDTGSSGLRILSSALSVALPQQIDSSSNAVAECGVFSDGVTWGPVQTADVKMASEVASSLPIQVIGSASFSTVPADCSSQGVPEQDLANLGANGLLGVGPSIQDCGTDCVTSGTLSQGSYYTCPSSGCVDSTEALAQQVQNPVAFFATDNNGVIVELPAVTAPEASVTGSLIFGIGTQSNNGLGGATVFGTDVFGDFTTTYLGTQYPSFLDSGSNAIYFLDTTTTGLPVCTDINFLYCPASTKSFTVTNAGTNGATASLTFTVGNADLLISNLNNAAVNDLAGPNASPLQFDFGLPFFFGRNVYTAIVGKSTPGGTGPYMAY
jgi:Protein of unknown function (DUF3443)